MGHLKPGEKGGGGGEGGEAWWWCMVMGQWCLERRRAWKWVSCSGGSGAWWWGRGWVWRWGMKMVRSGLERGRGEGLMMKNLGASDREMWWEAIYHWFHTVHQLLPSHLKNRLQIPLPENDRSRPRWQRAVKHSVCYVLWGKVWGDTEIHLYGAHSKPPNANCPRWEKVTQATQAKHQMTTLYAPSEEETKLIVCRMRSSKGKEGKCEEETNLPPGGGGWPLLLNETTSYGKDLGWK